METTQKCYIGIDPSLTNTGLVLVDETGKLLQACTLCTKSTDLLADRLQYIYKSVSELLEIWCKDYNVETIAIEEPVIGGGGGNFIMKQMQAVGVIKVAVSNSVHKVYTIVNVWTAKSMLGIKRGWTKASIRKHVQLVVHGKDFDFKLAYNVRKQMFKKYISNEHEADAYAIINAVILFHNLKQDGKTRGS